ncbi:MAG: hypothetical protein V4629_04675 [Pseudomonadota bacterium]
MGDIVDLNRRSSSELVDLLESLVIEARSGRLSSIAAVVLRDNEADFEIHAPDMSNLEMIGALECLKAELLIADD